MNFFKKYNEYLKDNKEGYWFKRKMYGWGWVPVKWQGWVFLFAWLVLFIYLIGSTRGFIADFIIVFLMFGLLILVCYLKGEKPKWQWGPAYKEHYVCLGGCRGVSMNPGVCQSLNCANHNHELIKCNCIDGLHYNFDPSKFNK